DRANQFIERFRYKATKARQVQSRIKTLEKLEKIQVPDQKAIVAKFGFPEPRRSARTVVEMTDVSVGYDGEPVLTGVNLVVERGDKLSLVGPNGAGKSTLLKLLLGNLEPMSGTCTIGNNVDVAYFAQHQVESLDLSQTVAMEFAARVGTDNQPKGRNLRTVLGSFGFSGEAADRRIGDLSGGERTRLALAVCMANPVNLLVLDEPTNHLDLPSCDVLEDALSAYPGTVLLVSHDRHLIRSVAHDLLEVRNGVVKLHSGVEENVLSPSFSGGTAGPGVKAAPTPPPRQQKTATAVKKEKKAAQAASSQQRKPGGGPAVKELRKNVARIEKALAAAETEVADLNRQLADPEVFSDHEKAAELGRQFGEAKDR
ncbi:MAG TPA: ATP-binding cassette domain-containing protein, partial [Microthrixaceae bacterium]|nr:ATP-binding cassette domain-containing protein [Microthrixaceae bacterium]